MGRIVRKITKPISKVFDKVIPNEIKPALPYIAAAAPFLAPGTFGAAAGSIPGLGGIQNQFIRQAVQRGVLGTGLNIGSQLAQEGNEGDIKLGRAVLAGLPAAFTTPGLAENLGAQAELVRETAGADAGIMSQIKSGGLDVLSKVAGAGEKASKAPLFSAAKAKGLSVPLTQQATFDAMDFAKQAQADYEAELAEYNKFIEDQNLAKVANDEDRARAIYNSMINAGAFTVDTIKDTLDQLNLPSGFFAYGGRVRKAEGGIMDLGGREMDMRAGGFIPIGAKEKADDVPARLSKNEFVMTADAVRGAGNGSINKGAKRMYDLMNRLESKV